MSNALTSFETPINMQPFAMLWFISLYLFLWCGGVCVYHYLPRNELGEKYIPGMNFALSDVGIFHGQECCGSRYYDTNTNITNWTIFVVCFPLLTDIFLFGLYIGSILWSLVALQRNFGIIFLVASDSYAGSYKIFFDLTSFYRTFTYTEGTYLTSSGTAVYMPRCLSYNPVVSIKLGIGFAVIGFILMCIVIRVSNDVKILFVYCYSVCALWFVVCGLWIVVFISSICSVWCCLDCFEILLENIYEISNCEESTSNSNTTVGNDICWSEQFDRFVVFSISIYYCYCYC